MTAWRFINLGMAIVGVIVWVLWMRRNPERMGYAYAPLSYMIHVIVFYICYMNLNLNIQFVNGWSNAIRLHGLILAITATFIVGWTLPWKSTSQ